MKFLRTPLGLGVALCAWMCSAQTQTAQDRPQKGSRGALRSSLIAVATAVEHPPKLDGTLEDPVWRQAQPITNFRQREPYEGQPATERTEVRILYTRREVYFGIACFDSEANAIVASEFRRDVSQELDDYFEIVIDSAHDRRNAYFFEINPLKSAISLSWVVCACQPGLAS